MSFLFFELSTPSSSSSSIPMVSAENGIAVDFVKSKVGLNPFVDGDFSHYWL